jgi:hypothetical protein
MAGPTRAEWALVSVGDADSVDTCGQWLALSNVGDVLVAEIGEQIPNAFAMILADQDAVVSFIIQHLVSVVVSVPDLSTE